MLKAAACMLSRDLLLPLLSFSLAQTDPTILNLLPHVSCSSSNSVTAIDLSSRGISGTPNFTALCSLPSLLNLYLPNNNSLYWPLAPGIRTCVGLRSLDLSFNQFSGPIPDLSPMKKLQTLKLGQIQFIGVFP